ncbi:XRE family transcriptional regulator [Achromobacter sp. LC458]|uniref:XRE family transcriptional regulator n=1 Tax=Achromobacter spanius TaxID=217203 RepID=A0A2S5GRH4_9BURK|nr:MULTISPECIES: XRE family transcriptional regulator [Achromobacter]PPA75441.1 XRE family transcriptional regulator [Achromobacter spanius]TRM52376.1 XRE family transcriptional regulator [Achromobacter sp. LC458]
MIDLPPRLRTLRRQQALSLEQLAQRTGLTKSYLSKLERGLSEPSISTVLRLAEAYGVGVSQLVGEDGAAQDEVVSVVRVGDREALQRGGPGVQYHYESLAGRRKVKAMEPFVVHPPRDFPDATAVFPHPGEEFLLVLKGAVEVQVGERQFRLETGDSVYFDSELPHRMRTVSRAMAEVLVVAAH